MIHGKLKDGKLTNITYREPVTWDDGGVDVELVEMPMEMGTLAYDATQKKAKLVVTEDNRLDKISASGKVQVALAIRLSTLWPAQIKLAHRERIQAIIDAAAAQGIAVLDD